MADVMAKLRNMDMYPKTKDEFRVRTMQGGVSSLFAVVVAIILVRSELKHSLAVSTHDRLFVNSSHGDGLSVRFELEFPRANCELLAIDANDESGQPLEGVQQHVIKTRLDTNGRRVLVNRKAANSVHKVGDTATSEEHLAAPDEAKPAAACGDCYGAQDDERPCCATCDDVRAAYRKRGWTFHEHTVAQCAGELAEAALDLDSDEGCSIKGTLELPAVSGNFHVAPGRHLQTSGLFKGMDLVQLTFDKFNVSHTVKQLRFGPDERSLEPARASRRVVGPDVDLSSQLDGESRTLGDGYGMHQYYLKVVPTVYKNLGGKTRELWQYSVTEHVRHVAPGSGKGLPGVFFFYEVSPLCAEFVERRNGWLALLTGLAAIVGGVHATAGIADRALAYLGASVGGKASAKLGI